MKNLNRTAVLYFLMLATVVNGQQITDTAYNFVIANPRYPVGKGSRVTVDAAHYNFHTLDGRYGPFGKVLANDGYLLASNDRPVTDAVLRESRIFVISNPLDSSNIDGWQLPTPSAFSPAEIAAINEWVKNGGRLLLIADHMPFAGAAQALAQSFGFRFLNCYAFDNRRRNLERFYRGNQSLSDDEITHGVDTVVTFTGSAFKIPKNAKPILSLKNYTLLLPEVAWQFEESTPALPGDGFFQGAYMDYGKGKIVVMGEAGMFTAQLAGPNQIPFGLNRPGATANNQLLLNIIHWLDK